MCAQPLMAVVVVALDGCLFDCAVNVFDLPSGSGKAGFGQAMVDAMEKTDPVEWVARKRAVGPVQLRGAINGHEQVQLALGGAQLGQIDMEVADQVAPELLHAWLAAAFHLGQPTDPMPLNGFCREAVDRGILQMFPTLEAGQLLYNVSTLTVFCTPHTRAKPYYVRQRENLFTCHQRGRNAAI